MPEAEEPSSIIIQRLPLKPPSAEDLEIMKTPDQELWNRTHVFSFDHDECKRRMVSGDQWHRLIQAHLYLEHIVSLMLADALVDPSAIGAARMAFAQKLALARAMGLIDADVAATMGKINSLRNKVAHDLSFSITQASENDLFNATSQRMREAAVAHMGREKGSRAQFSDILYCVIWIAEVTRHAHIHMRILGKKHALIAAKEISESIKTATDRISEVTDKINSIGRGSK